MENSAESLPVFFQVLVAGLGLAIVVVIIYTLMYVADELEDSAVWPVGRFIKALFGGLIWVLFGVVVSAGLFAIAIVVWYLFFRPLFSYYVLQYNAIWAALVVVGFYLLWGVYHGARNKLPISYRFRRKAPQNLQESG
jgi:hypothetical protein